LASENQSYAPPIVTDRVCSSDFCLRFVQDVLAVVDEARLHSSSHSDQLHLQNVTAGQGLLVDTLDSARILESDCIAVKRVFVVFKRAW